MGKVWEDLSLEVITVDLGGGRRLWRQEVGSIILQKNNEKDFLYEKPENSDWHKTAYMTFHGLSCKKYGWHVFEQPLWTLRLGVC